MASNKSTKKNPTKSGTKCVKKKCVAKKCETKNNQPLSVVEKFKLFLFPSLRNNPKK